MRNTSTSKKMKLWIVIRVAPSWRIQQTQALRAKDGMAKYVVSEAQRQTRSLYWLAAFSGQFPAAAGHTRGDMRRTRAGIEPERELLLIPFEQGAWCAKREKEKKKEKKPWACAFCS